MVGLSGPLGAGKTVLIRGIAAGMGLPSESVTSPTFVFMNIYAAPGRGRLIHLDLYRIEETDEVMRLGLLDEAGPGDATVIEWAERAKGLLPPDAVWMTIEEEPSSESSRGSVARTITIEDFSDRLQEPI